MSRWSEESCCLPVGCSSIDELLSGGVRSRELLEIWGPPGSGKTQFCHALAAHVIASTGHSVAYVCGSCDFSASRLRQLLTQQVDESHVAVVMQKIRVFRVFEVFELLACLQRLYTAVEQEVDSYHANLGLLVLDPVTLYLSPLLGSKQGRAMIGHVSRVLIDVAIHLGLAVVCTNNVVVDMATSTGGGVKAALGQLWASIPSHRLQLSFTQQQHNRLAPPTLSRHHVPLAPPTSSRQLSFSSSTRKITVSGKAVFFITDSGLTPC